MAMRGRKILKDKRDKREAQTKKLQLVQRRKMCRFCADKKLVIDYKNARVFQPMLSERGRIIPRRITGNCAKHQRDVTVAIKRARILAFIPFTTVQQPSAT